MLVLSRKEGQTILIGDNIKIKLCRIDGTSVRIGLQAPTDIKIIRGELSSASAPLGSFIASRRRVVDSPALQPT